MESLNRIVIKKHEINRAFSFKPYFIWLAPYTNTTVEKCLLKRECFKPCFIWLAPYTKMIKRLLWKLLKSFKPYFIWSASFI